jgi:hypothetical protein
MVSGMNNIQERKEKFIFNMELYERYKRSKSQDLDEKISVLNDIIRQYPKIIDYVYNRVDTCFGPHIVYLVHMRVGGVDMIKIGYTKNSVQARFSESRYAGRDEIEIVEIIRENTLQAKASVDFEKALKTSCVPYAITTELTLPGKGEFMNIQHRDAIIEVYDRLYPSFSEIVGLKAPN